MRINKSCSRLKKLKYTRNKYRQSISFRIKCWNEVETRVSIPESLWFRLSSGQQITHWGKSRSTTTATIQIHPPLVADKRDIWPVVRWKTAETRGWTACSVRENNGGNDDFSRRTSLSTTYFPLCIGGSAFWSNGRRTIVMEY